MSAKLSYDKILILDGAMGTVLQQRGLPAGAQPELLSLTYPELLENIHREYIDAGSHVIYANTFGANTLKLAKTGHTPDEVIPAAIAAAKRAADGTETLVALDIGPLGELLEPLGTLSFESAYNLFREMVLAGARAGADLIVIETMTDLYEAKAALLAAKENSTLPVWVTMSFDDSGRTFTGCTIPSMAHTLEGLGADAIGLNCSLGPDRLLPLLKDLCSHTTLPVIAKPNAGLPDPVDGHYDMDCAAFTHALSLCVEAGASIMGGCCGTSPEYIRNLSSALQHLSPLPRPQLSTGLICTPSVPVTLNGIRVIGERINPTGKKRFQQALLEHDLDYILDVAVQQEDAGADILDVNVGYPGVDEKTMLPQVVKALQSAVSLPLQLDSSDPDALEAALRVYNGKAAVNSVNGDSAVLERILPIVKKYGAAVVGLTMDHNGIPQTAEERFGIAQRILSTALAHGIPKEDVWIDPLTLTVSAQQDQAVQTLQAVNMIRRKLGLQVVLGVSNISFGLPNRTLITQNFLIQAMHAGLSLPIINPNQKDLMDAVYAFRVLSGEDEQCRAYVERFSTSPVSSTVTSGGELSLEDAVIRGLKSEAGKLAKRELENTDELTLVQQRLIPALDRVGEGYEAGRLFLPQLLAAAQAAQAVFEVIRTSVAEKGGSPIKKGKLIVATVQGDIHDIGKNIVRTVLENYGYEVIDLGRDVPPETVAQAVTEKDVRLVGLSALMTTTLPAMAETVQLLRALPNPPVIFVGGAVVTAQYAAQIGADHYAKDARDSVEITRKVLG